MIGKGSIAEFWWTILDKEPCLICIAGPNGAGKSTFYFGLFEKAGLPFVNADIMARELGSSPYVAAEMAEHLRREWIKQRRSFVFETVFSDPAGAKLQFLKDAAEEGYTVVLCFIGIKAATTSMDRVAIRVLQGGHDVPNEKLVDRFPRTLANLRAAIPSLPFVVVYDNSDLGDPYREVAVFESGKARFMAERLPEWFKGCL